MIPRYFVLKLDKVSIIRSVHFALKNEHHKRKLDVYFNFKVILGILYIMSTVNSLKISDTFYELRFLFEGRPFFF